MWLRQKPDKAAVERFLASQGQSPFSYPAQGATRAGGPMAGYRLDHRQVDLGAGQDVFQRAQEAVQRWEMFSLEWVTLCFPSAPVETGTVVGILVRHAGLWSLHAARIVYVIDEPRRFGFAYGTLPDHAEQGEERFLIEWRTDDSVWYDLLAFSRPRALLARIGYPVTRWMQKRFARGSLAAMQRAVSAKRPESPRQSSL